MKKTKVISTDEMGLLRMVLVGEPNYFSTIEQVVAKFKWARKIIKDDAKEIAKCELASGDYRGWGTLIEVNGDELTYINRWLKRYEKGTWLVYSVPDDDTGGGWYIGKLKKGVEI